jgi:hypothetical protein
LLGQGVILWSGLSDFVQFCSRVTSDGLTARNKEGVDVRCVLSTPSDFDRWL